MALVGCVAMLAAVAGCNDGGAGKASAGASPTKIDACKLIAPDEAGKILGTTVTSKAVDTSAAGPNSGSICNYSDGTVAGGFMVIAAPVSGDLAKMVAEQEKSIVADFKKNAGIDVTVEDIAGLGDAAFVVKGGGMTQLHVLGKGASLVIQRNVEATPDVVKQSEAVARAALGNL